MGLHRTRRTCRRLLHPLHGESFFGGGVDALRQSVYFLWAFFWMHAANLCIMDAAAICFSCAAPTKRMAAKFTVMTAGAGESALDAPHLVQYFPDHQALHLTARQSYMPTTGHFFFKTAQILDLRCVLVPAPWVLWQ